jgi:DNA-binding CsgD family transcriptional regulator
MFKLLCRARGPFTWKQVMQLPLTPRQHAIMQARQNAGLLGGVGVPLQGADTSLIGISIMSTQVAPPDDNTTLSQLFAVSNQFQLQRARVLGVEQAFVLPDIHLTPREREMLEWAAQGKSNGVIASILEISEKTVEFHFKSIFGKLNVSSRTTAVLKAVHMRLIDMSKWG